MEAVYDKFEIEKAHSFGCFTEEIIRSLYLPRILRWPAILFLSWLDHLVLKTGLLVGKLIIVYARKPGGDGES